ncbi:lysine-2,3-aminomutase-like protein [Labrys sp. KNU-23]|uniref:lysine-2,3-aminomutase-like protein n=1 Tax=Labrys sp. KNU-23 TaxID=2789216 RepID=UPI0011EE7B3B|nr:lysine-2,3-aminomutase-like protein [Labrys sp. KNU-23]QEN90005.1 lysine-2,3-aminomutase-like protein [Labrys sp. KNU-23]
MNKHSSLRSASDLEARGLISSAERLDIEEVARRFSVAITPAMTDLIAGSPQDDPIAAQFVPTGRELISSPDELTDPIGDDAFSPVKGIVHRYPDRVLLKPLHVCPVYCRFCFRREMVGPEGDTLTGSELDAALAYVANNPAIFEVIVTGGDPFALSPRRIGRIVKALSTIDHVGVIRFHTRVPVVAPERITDDLIESLDSPKGVFVALHANHVHELTPAAREACTRLVKAGIAMVSQTVLLKGVNATAEALSALFRALLGLRIKPYYLHHGDLAKGTGHFRTTIAEGQAVMRQLRGSLTGLGQPTYVLDIPGGHGKVPIGPCYLDDGENGPVVTDPRGNRHNYRS